VRKGVLVRGLEEGIEGGIDAFWWACHLGDLEGRILDRRIRGTLGIEGLWTFASGVRLWSIVYLRRM
jgi:hypothetical protein